MLEILDRATKDAVDDGYHDAVRAAYGVLLDNLVTGRTDAEGKFAAGVAKARQARDVALNVLAERAYR